MLLFLPNNEEDRLHLNSKLFYEVGKTSTTCYFLELRSANHEAS